jgi:hypothetical protein
MPPHDWTGRRGRVKPSKSVFLLALFSAIGAQIEFFRIALADPNRPRLGALALYWLLWDLLPILLFVISYQLKRRNR